ncbi:unnamed protein product [Vitrella brassicaformis CCMP3155]|uniref:Uncharacterized protein n=1 Tax=Vitrella brassicaformis (strain CCMP3155) TaxID=1169540 RepID=A0A0G4EVX0_VITBC|nr:unnamed protein product [Vitrella brassicaformis CCMP3155]|eukprot:CEM02577.1 unnamed protein product [Vitrella brassicaformis CCMP3155]
MIQIDDDFDFDGMEVDFSATAPQTTSSAAARKKKGKSKTGKAQKKGVKRAAGASLGQFLAGRGEDLYAFDVDFTPARAFKYEGETSNTEASQRAADKRAQRTAAPAQATRERERRPQPKQRPATGPGPNYSFEHFLDEPDTDEEPSPLPPPRPQPPQSVTPPPMPIASERDASSPSRPPWSASTTLVDPMSRSRDMRMTAATPVSAGHEMFGRVGRLGDLQDILAMEVPQEDTSKTQAGAVEQRGVQAMAFSFSDKDDKKAFSESFGRIGNIADLALITEESIQEIVEAPDHPEAAPQPKGMTRSKSRISLTEPPFKLEKRLSRAPSITTSIAYSDDFELYDASRSPSNAHSRPLTPHRPPSHRQTFTTSPPPPQPQQPLPERPPTPNSVRFAEKQQRDRDKEGTTPLVSQRSDSLSRAGNRGSVEWEGGPTARQRTVGVQKRVSKTVGVQCNDLPMPHMMHEDPFSAYRSTFPHSGFPSPFLPPPYMYFPPPPAPYFMPPLFAPASSHPADRIFHLPRPPTDLVRQARKKQQGMEKARRRENAAERGRQMDAARDSGMGPGKSDDRAAAGTSDDSSEVPPPQQPRVAWESPSRMMYDNSMRILEEAFRAQMSSLRDVMVRHNALLDEARQLQQEAYRRRAARGGR